MTKRYSKLSGTACGVLLALCAAIGSPSVSAQYLAVGVEPSMSYFKLSGNPVIRLTETGISVTDDEKDAPVEFSFAQIGKISFKNGEPPSSSIIRMSREPSAVVRHGDLFVFSGLEGEHVASIHSIDGRLVLNGRVSSDVPLSVASLQRGIYVLVVNNTKTKFIK